jgi:hypothetical protein
MDNKKWGGSRVGAGRKVTKAGAKRYGFIIDPKLQDEFENVSNKTDLINSLLEKYFKEIGKKR